MGQTEMRAWLDARHQARRNLLSKGIVATDDDVEAEAIRLLNEATDKV